MIYEKTFGQGEYSFNDLFLDPISFKPKLVIDKLPTKEELWDLASQNNPFNNVPKDFEVNYLTHINSISYMEKQVIDLFIENLKNIIIYNFDLPEDKAAKIIFKMFKKLQDEIFHYLNIKIEKEYFLHRIAEDYIYSFESYFENPFDYLTNEVESQLYQFFLKISVKHGLLRNKSYQKKGYVSFDQDEFNYLFESVFSELSDPFFNKFRKVFKTLLCRELLLNKREYFLTTTNSLLDNKITSCMYFKSSLIAN